jgi:hypothetical protein
LDVLSFGRRSHPSPTINATYKPDQITAQHRPSAEDRTRALDLLLVDE